MPEERSTRYSICPALMLWSVSATSIVTVPAFALGISPRGPRILPSFGITPRIKSGVAMVASKSSQPSTILSTNSSVPTKSAPASSASRALSPWAKTTTRTDFPVPCGSATVPRIFSSAFRASTPRRDAKSTVSSNFVALVFFTSEIASSTV